jgi:hypothetical protein
VHSLFLLASLVLATQPPATDATMLQLLGGIPAGLATCSRTWLNAPRAATPDGKTEVAVVLGSPLVRQRRATVLLSPTGRVLRYRESIDQPGRMWLAGSFANDRASQALVDGGRSTSGMKIEPSGLRRAEALAREIQAHCATTPLRPRFVELHGEASHVVRHRVATTQRVTS